MKWYPVRYWLPLVLYMGLIVFVSALEDPPAPDLGWPNIDKVYHLIEYSILGWLAFRTLHWRLTCSGYSLFVILLVTALFCVAFGITDELHQRFVTNRHASFADLAADSAGTMIGIVFGYIIVFLQQRRRTKMARRSWYQGS